MRKIPIILVLMPLCAQLMSGQSLVRDSLDTEYALTLSPAQLLRGKISGVQVSSSDGSVTGELSTVIRGLSSLHSDSEALWVIDGVCLGSSISQNRNAFWQDSYRGQSYTSALNSLFSLNLADIESIEVIKDLSATALYGSKGANGVISIKTRRPSKEGFSARENSNVGFNGSNSHYLEINSLNNRNALRLSAFYRQDRGSMERSSSLVGGVRANFDSKVSNRWWFGFGTSLSRGRQDAQSSTGYYGTQTAGSLLRLTGDYSGFVEDYDDYSLDVRSISNAYVQYNILQNLNLRAEAGLDYDNNNRYIWYGNKTSFGEKNNGAAALLSSSMLRYTVTSSVNSFYHPLDNLRLDLMAGLEYCGSVDKFNTLNGKDFFTHELRARSISLSSGKQDIHLFNRAMSNVGALTSLNLKYASLFGLTAAVRADKNPRYESSLSLYPAISAWLDIARLSHSDGQLRLKGGWGQAGRESFSPYELIGSFVPGASFVTAEEGTEILYEGFNKVRSREWNAGVDFSFLKGRLSGGISYYDKLSDDTFSVFCFGEPRGIHNRWFFSSGKLVAEDRASIRNKGIEFNLSAELLELSDLKLRVSANGAFQSSQICSVSDASSYGPSVGASVETSVNATGWPVSSILGYETDASGNFKDQTGDGLARTEDRVVLGRTAPLFLGGLSVRLAWKRISLFADADCALGHKVLDMNKMLSEGSAYVSDRYVCDASFLRLGRVSLCYDLPVGKRSFIRGASCTLSFTNPLIMTGYEGYCPDVNSFSSPYTRGLDYGSVPVAKLMMAGITLSF